MKRWYFVIGSFLLLLSLYLCYRCCNTDTKSPQKNNRIGIPDSSWLSAAIDLRSIRNEIAWNTLLNGDIQALFRSDSNSNTFIQLLTSPSDYSIHENAPVYYFSKWNNGIQHHGFIFSLQGAEKLDQYLKGDSSTTIGLNVHTARTTEGFWIYDEQELLFLFAEKNDSIDAVDYFLQTPVSSKLPTLSDSVRVSILIDTKYIATNQCSSALGSTRIAIQLSTKGKSLQASWTYQGPFEYVAENTELTEPLNHSGLYYTAKHSSSLFHKIQDLLPAADSMYRHNKELADHLSAVIEDNTIQASFNGWDQIKSSYYVSEMNDEFETVLKKKDTSFREPVFQIQVTQIDHNRSIAFITYLQKQGLISLQKKGIYEIIPGNFDSDLILQQDYSLLVKNKHNRQTITYSKPFNAAFLIDLNTEIFNRSDITNNYSNILNVLNTIEHVRILGTQTKEGMNGNLIITYKENNYPLLQLLKNSAALTH